METLVRFKKINGKRIILFHCSDFENDGSFLTRTTLNPNNRDNEFYKAEKVTSYITKITPKVSYERFIKTTEYNEANLLTIRFYAGNEIQDVIKGIDSKTFIVDDKLIVEYQVPTEKYPNGSSQKAKGRINDILKYKGLDHIDKPLEQIKYEGDCYTKIELLDDCNYVLYKHEKNEIISENKR